MTALAGIIDFGALPSAAALRRALVVDQACYGRDALDCGSEGPAHFGRVLHRRFAEDAFDRQPARARSGQLIAVADLRLDNRSELTRALGIDAGEARRLADCDLLVRAWSHWGDAVFDRLSGTYAVALWDSVRRRLVLARDPFGQSPLHFVHGDGWLAFASMPQALRLVPGVDGSPDLVSLGAFVADVPRRGRASFFRDIERIEPGHALSFSPGEMRYWRHWNPSLASRSVAPGELAERFRYFFDQAVESCLRGVKGPVAAHLSSGWDSAAVASNAAVQLAPSRRVIGFTAAPPADFDGPVPSGRCADESGLAALVAARHPNLEHRIIRDRSVQPVSLLEDNDRMVGEPTGYVCNNLWWTAINRAAGRESPVLLTAEMGNHTLSAGGAMQLADLVRTGQAGRWLRESRGLAARGAVRWTGILDQSFGPFVPFYGRVRPLLARSGRREEALSLLSTDVRRAVAERMEWDFFAGPPGNSVAHRAAMLGQQDSGAFRKASLARWGVDERDPTTERRFVEFCLSLPGDALLRDGMTRPVARAALADLLPPAVLASRTRGLQFADWHEHIARAEVAERLTGDHVQGLFDRPTIAGLLARWPKGGFERADVVRTYRMDLMRAVSAASFVATYSRGGGAVRSGGFAHGSTTCEFNRGNPADFRPGQAGVM